MVEGTNCDRGKERKSNLRGFKPGFPGCARAQAGRKVPERNKDEG